MRTELFKAGYAKNQFALYEQCELSSALENLINLLPSIKAEILKTFATIEVQQECSCTISQSENSIFLTVDVLKVLAESQLQNLHQRQGQLLTQVRDYYMEPKFACINPKNFPAFHVNRKEVRI